MASSPRETLTAVRAPHGTRIFEVSWGDGKAHRVPHEVLRGYCPCAGCQGHTPGIAFQTGGDLELRELEPVGNYALQLTWGDGHSSGIYTFAYLRTLGDLVEQYGEQLVELRPPLSKL